MRLSESLRKGIMESKVGGVINRFKIRSRRSVLFFEDILANYVRICEENGKKDDTFMVAKKWATLSTQQLLPKWVNDSSKILLLNFVTKKIWRNIGLLEYFNGEMKNDVVHIKTRKEFLTRILGRNEFMKGFFNGCTDSFFNRRSKIIEYTQSEQSCNYSLKLEKGFLGIKAKNKDIYNDLNYLPKTEGFTLKDALKMKLFQLKENNRIYFRGKSITPTENTIFHILGNEGPLLHKLPHISRDYFSEVIEKNTTDEKKLTLLKTLLQIMGWGIVKIIIKNKNVVVSIKNPPYGLQAEEDNWKFISNVILGYLWLLKENFVIAETSKTEKHLEITYST
ncbi:MAG: hypothetical protein V3U72_04450 [Candidatus Aenigmarchaeota archaeon]